MHVVAVALIGLLLVAASAPAPSLASDFPDASGAAVVATTRHGERLMTVEIDSPSVGQTSVSLLLPARYEAQPERTWPVLYLLHGATNDHATWLEETNVEGLTEDLDILVVMPDGGDYGFYSDGWDAGADGRPMWETYHLEELPRLLEDGFHASEVRAVAGPSMGGFGAVSYAARRPGMFRAAASFSGILDIFSLGRLGEDVWGDREDHLEAWLAHDPITLAPALEGTALYVSWGSGEPGPLDADEARFDVVEAWLAAGNERFADRLADLGLSATVDSYGPGTHTWPYWERALAEVLPMLMASLGDPATT